MGVSGHSKWSLSLTIATYWSLPLHGFREAAPVQQALASLIFLFLTSWKERQPCNVQRESSEAHVFRGQALGLPHYGSLLWPHTALGLTPDSDTHYDNVDKLLDLVGPLQRGDNTIFISHCEVYT